MALLVELNDFYELVLGRALLAGKQILLVNLDSDIHEIQIELRLLVYSRLRGHDVVGVLRLHPLVVRRLDAQIATHGRNVLRLRVGSAHGPAVGLLLRLLVIDRELLDHLLDLQLLHRLVRRLLLDSGVIELFHEALFWLLEGLSLLKLLVGWH